jgi:hypothetical protein
MKQTTAWQIPYPESPDHTRTWEYWQAIAERVDTCLTTIGNRTVDTGIITNLPVAYQTGWALNSPCQGRRFGPFCWVWLNAKRTGANLSTPANGDLVNSPVLQITDTRFQGALDGPWTPFYTPSSASVTSGGAALGATGMFTLASYLGSALIATNDVVYYSAAYAVTN